METRVCKRCGKEKPTTRDYFHRHTPKGKNPWWSGKCKVCVSAEWKEKNRVKNPKLLMKEMEDKELKAEGKKKCSKCFEIKPLNDEFFSLENDRGKLRFRARCKDCVRARKKNAYNTEEGKGKAEKQAKRYYLKNKVTLDLKSKERWEKNKLKYSQKRNQTLKARYDNDVQYHLSVTIRNRTLKAFKFNGFKKDSKTSEMLGCDWNVLKNHIENQFFDGMSWINRSDWHIDHIIPLASAESEYEMMALAYYKNLQPLWEFDNLSKNDDFDPEDKRKYLEWYSANVKKL